MIKIIKHILHQNDVIHEYERLTEHLLVCLATRSCIPHRPFNKDMIPDVEGLCNELGAVLEELSKCHSLLPKISHKKESLS
jgi:hypothetical protein